MPHIIVLSDREMWETLDGDLKPEIWRVSDRTYALLASGELRPRDLSPREILAVDPVDVPVE